MHQQNMTIITWKSLGSGPRPECPGGVPQGQICSSASSVSSKGHCPFNEKERVLRKKSEAKATLTSEACPNRENGTGPISCTHIESTDGGAGICHGPGTPAHSHWSLPKSLLKTVQ